MGIKQNTGGLQVLPTTNFVSVNIANTNLSATSPSTPQLIATLSLTNVIENRAVHLGIKTDDGNLGSGIFLSNNGGYIECRDSAAQAFASFGWIRFNGSNNFRFGDHFLMIQSDGATLVRLRVPANSIHAVDPFPPAGSVEYRLYGWRSSDDDSTVNLGEQIHAYAFQI